MYQKKERKDIKSYEAVTLNNLSVMFLKVFSKTHFWT